MDYYNMDYPEVDATLDYEYVPPYEEVYFEGDCVQNKPLDITPYSLASTFEDSQTNFTSGYHEDMLVQEPGQDSVYRLIKGTENRHFRNNHPCAKLTKGVMISFVNLRITKTAVVEAIDLDQGTITFKDPPGVPYMVVDSFGGDMEKRKTYETLLELDKRWSFEQSDIRDFFLRKKHLGGVLKDNDRFAYTQGVVGSGKSYELVQDIVRLRTPGIWQFVVAETNSALLNNGAMLEKKGLRVLHFSRKDTPYSMVNLLKDNVDYRVWDQMTKIGDRNPKQQAEFVAVRDRLLDYMQGYVILITPSKAENLRKMIRNDDQLVNIFLDEAGLMAFSRFVTLLLFKINRLWIYGDHEQHEPFDEDAHYVPPQDVHYQKMAQRTREIAVKSVAWLFEDMNYPKRYLSMSRRIPKVDAEKLLPFMYEGGKNWIEASNWLESKMPKVKKSYDSTCWVPPSILSYPRLTEDRKNREAVRMRRFMNWFFFHVKANGTHDGTVRDCKSEPDYVFISSHHYILGALEEEMNKWYCDKNYDLRKWKFSYVTTKAAQSNTYRNVVYYIPETATSFITDPHHLVALSRHKEDLVVAPYHVRSVVRIGILSVMAAIGIISLAARTVASKGKNGYSKNKRDGGMIKFDIFVKDYARLQQFFCTRQYEEYRKLIDYPHLHEDAKARWRVSARISDPLLKSFLDDPTRPIDFPGSGKYKHALLLFTKETFVMPRGSSKGDILNFKGELVDHDRYGVRIDISGHWDCKKGTKSIGTRKSGQTFLKVDSKGRRVPHKFEKSDLKNQPSFISSPSALM